MNTMNTTNFETTTDLLGSLAISAAYGPGMPCRKVCDNGKEFDMGVTLYEAADGTYFALTNGDPIFQQDFDNMGLMDIHKVSQFVLDLEYIN